jgi:hypothetical protein
VDSFEDFIFADTEDTHLMWDENIELPNGVKLDSFIDEGYIRINRDLWNKIECLSDRDLESIISFLIDKYKLQYPHSHLTEVEVENNFINLLKFNTSKLLIKGKCATKIPRNDLPDYYLKNELVGRISSDYFQRDNRIKCSGITSASPYVKWTQSGKRTWLKSVINEARKKKYINESTIRNPLTKHFLASQFLPIVAKFIINKFNAKKVVDFSSGWGDRLCGFYASNAEEYIGIDPNIDLHPSYEKQIGFYKKFVNNKKTTLIAQPAETIDFSQFDEYDMIFTSPPYFNIEKYSMDESQSHVKYKNYNTWLSEFLFKTISNSLSCLKKDGYIAINIADTNTNKFALCDAVLDYMKTQKVKYLGCVPFRCPNRFNSGSYEGTVVEPIFIWQSI